MKISAITMSIFSLIFVAGCSEQNANKSVASSSVEKSPIKTVSLSKDIPADIKGQASEVAGRCAVDNINTPVRDAVTTVSRAAGLNIWGWALDEKSTSVPSQVFLHLLKGTENYYGQLNRLGDRSDLAKAFGKSDFVNAGYAGSVDISSLAVGRYEIFIIQKSENKSLVCATNRVLELRD